MKKQIPVIIILLVALISIIGFAYYHKQTKSNPVTSGTVKVVASFYPLAEFATHVGGNIIQISTIVPSGTEPHEYEPTPQELAQVYAADVFIYNGSGIDPWAERIASDVKQKNVHVINMTERLSTLPQGDPHFWLDPVLAQQEVIIIRDALITADPAQTEMYQANTREFIAQLQALHEQYQAGLTACLRRDIVTSHNAFAYLAKRYSVTVLPVAGLSPEEEPSAKQISEITKIAQQKNIQYIFFETLVSPKLAETVATEIGAKTLVFNPLEGLTDEEKATGKNYISIMQDNLQNLRLALQCQ